MEKLAELFGWFTAACAVVDFLAVIVVVVLATFVAGKLAVKWTVELVGQMRISIAARAMRKAEEKRVVELKRNMKQAGVSKKIFQLLHEQWLSVGPTRNR